MSLIFIPTLTPDRVSLPSLSIPVQTVGAQEVILVAHEIPENSLLTCIGYLVIGHRVGGGAAEGDFVNLNVNGSWNRQGTAAAVMVSDGPGGSMVEPEVTAIGSGKGAGGVGAGTISGASGTIGLNRNTVEITVLGVAGATIDWYILFSGQVRIMKR